MKNEYGELMTQKIDLNFRPRIDFEPLEFEEAILQKIKGASLRKKVRALFESGRHSEVSEIIGPNGLSTDDIKAMESFHPKYMGGNYLPELEDDEFEIARIVLRSTTRDVISVYAKRDINGIRFRVVDEYEANPPPLITGKVPTLGEFTCFFLDAWPLIDLLKMNYSDDLKGGLAFFSGESTYYADFDARCRQLVVEAFAKSPG